MSTLKQQHSLLAEEYEALTKSEPPVVVLERENVILRSDKERFGVYMEHLAAKKSKLESSVAMMREELEEQGLPPFLVGKKPHLVEKETTRLEMERSDLQQVVDNQEISPAYDLLSLKASNS